MVNPSVEIFRKVDDLTGKHSFEWKFTATLTVSDVWVQDGFDLTLERLQDNIEKAFRNDLDYAYEDEVVVSNVEITSAPTPDTIRAAMGYPD